MANEEKEVEVSNRESEWRDHYFLFLDLELYGAMDANCDMLIRDWILHKDYLHFSSLVVMYINFDNCQTYSQNRER